MAELKTIAKTDPQFRKFLLGTFSKYERALPVESLNILTEAEQVTFKILKVSEVENPGLFRKFLEIFKLKNFLLLLVPLFLILTKIHMDGEPFDATLAIYSCLSAIFLLAAFNLNNDYQDHMSGLDRIQAMNTGHAIQKGWITAAQVRKLSFVFLLIAIVFAIPVVLITPWLLIIALPLGLVLLSSVKMGFKFLYWTEMLALLLFGPVLTIGFQIAIGVEFDLEAIFIGVLCGWVTVLLMHLKNFELILVNSQAGFKNSMTTAGFEKGKKIIALWWVLFIIFLDIFHYLYTQIFWSFAILLISLFLSWAFLKILYSLSSPVVSTFKKQLQMCRTIVFLVLSLWVIENLSYILVLEFVSA